MIGGAVFYDQWESSPNQRQHQTGAVNTMGIESKPKATSDRFDESKGNQKTTIFPQTAFSFIMTPTNILSSSF